MQCLEKAVVAAIDGFTDDTVEWIDEYLYHAGRKNSGARGPQRTLAPHSPVKQEREA